MTVNASSCNLAKNFFLQLGQCDITIQYIAYIIMTI